MPISIANVLRRPKRWVPLSLAGLIAVGGLGTGTALTMLGDGSPVAGAQKLADIASVFAARSPGERTVGMLSDKTATTVAGERDSAPMTPAPEGKPLPIKAVGVGGAGLPAESLVALADVPSVAQFAPVFPLPFGPEVPPGVILPGVTPGSPPGGGGGFPDGGGIVTPPGNPPVVTPPPPVSPVPEPATWLSMILGFGLIGRTLRRRRLTASEPRSDALAHGL